MLPHQYLTLIALLLLLTASSLSNSFSPARLFLGHSRHTSIPAAGYSNSRNYPSVSLCPISTEYEGTYKCYQAVDDTTNHKQLPRPHPTPIIPLQPIDQRPPLSRNHPIIYPLRPHRHVHPTIHLLYLPVKILRIHLSSPHHRNRPGGGGHDVVFFGFRVLHHALGEDFWDTADLGADDVETAGGGFDEDSAECFREGGVEVYVTANHNVADLFVADGPDHFNPVLEHVFFDHLLEVNGFWTGAGNEEVHARVDLTNPRDRCHQQIGPLVVEQPRDNDDSKMFFRRLRGVRTEVLGNNGVGDDGHTRRIERRTEDGVLFARVRDAYNMVDIRQRKLQQLVRQNTPGIGETEQRMIRKTRPQPHRPRVQDRLVAHGRHRPVPVDDFDALPDKDVAEDREAGENGREGRLAVDHLEGDVVAFQTVGEVADPVPGFVGVRDDDDFVAAVGEFAGELVDVRFDAALREVRKG